MYKRGFILAKIVAIFVIFVTVLFAMIAFSVQSLGGVKSQAIEGYDNAGRLAVNDFLISKYDDKRVYDMIVDYCRGEDNEKEIKKASRDVIWGDSISLEISCQNKNREFVVRPFMCEFEEHLFSVVKDSKGNDVSIGEGSIDLFFEYGEQTQMFGARENFRVSYCYGKGFLRT